MAIVSDTIYRPFVITFQADRRGERVIGKLTITVTKTADGRFDYVQIASPAAMPVNIVLIADQIEIEDRRPTKKAKR